jgi:very-short-patch-repair endonuclease
LSRVRNLRRQSTDAEAALWRHLRSRQLGGAKFRRQHEFGPYTLDFYCAEHRLAVEADGGQHLTPEGLAGDEMRRRYLQTCGIRVLRFSNLDVLNNLEGVLETILLALDRPSP